MGRRGDGDPEKEGGATKPRRDAGRSPGALQGGGANRRGITSRGGSAAAKGNPIVA